MTPAAFGRHTALLDLALAAQAMADRKRAAITPAVAPQDRDYLAAGAQAAQQVADAIRRMPGCVLRDEPTGLEYRGG